MAINSLATPSWVLKETARGFTNEVRLAAAVNRDYDDAYRVNGAKIGYTVHARLPQRFMVTRGEALQLQPLMDQTVPISLTTQNNIAWSYSSADQTMLIEELRERRINPAAEALANAVDVAGFETLYPEVWNVVGTPGVTPTANTTFLQAGAKLTNQAAGSGARVAILDPQTRIGMVNANFALFNPSATISAAFRTGQFSGEVLGIGTWVESANTAKHTTGTFTASTPVVNGAGQTGSSLVTSGWASGAATLKKGDVFTIAGVYQINPLSYRSTGALQQFVVTGDVSDSAGAMTIPISPSIITSGSQLQTVDSSPANSAAITVLGSTGAVGGTLATTVSPQSLIFHRDFATMVAADLARDLPGAEVTRVASRVAGISIRLARQWQITTDQNPSRLDILYGWAVLQPRLAVRVAG
jgi:hypothetical protein